MCQVLAPTVMLGNWKEKDTVLNCSIFFFFFKKRSRTAQVGNVGDLVVYLELFC